MSRCIRGLFVSTRSVVYRCIRPSACGIALLDHAQISRTHTIDYAHLHRARIAQPYHIPVPTPHGQGTQPHGHTTTFVHCKKSHEALLAGQVMVKAYEDDLEGVYRCFRALCGVTQPRWAFELYRGHGFIVARIIVISRPLS